MSRPEPSNEPSLDLEESLALVRRIIAEGAPAPKPAAVAAPHAGMSRAPAADATSTSATSKSAGSKSAGSLSAASEMPASAYDLPSVLRSAAPEPRPAPLLGRLTDALRTVTAGGTSAEQRLGFDDDLADLVDFGPARPSGERSAAARKETDAVARPPAERALEPERPQLSSPATAMPDAPLPDPQAQTLAQVGAVPRPAEPRDTSLSDLRVRARVAPSLDSEQRHSDQRSARAPLPVAPPAAGGERRWPSLDMPSVPGPSAAAQPAGARNPGVRLPALGDIDAPQAVAKPQPAAAPATGGEAAGWPRAAMRAPAAGPGPVSAPPSEPVVIAAMARVEPRAAARAAEPAESTLSSAAAFMEGASRQPAAPAVAPLSAAGEEHIERHEDQRFEVIAAMAPSPRAAAAKAPPATAEKAPAPADARLASAAGQGPVETGPAAESGEASSSKGVGAESPSVIAAALVSQAAPAEMPIDTAETPIDMESSPRETASSPIEDVASALGKLVAGLAAAAPAPAPIADTMAETMRTHDEERDSGGEEQRTPDPESGPESGADPGPAAEDDMVPDAMVPDAMVPDAMAPDAVAPVTQNHVAQNQAGQGSAAPARGAEAAAGGTAPPAPSAAAADEAPPEETPSVVSSPDAFIAGVHAQGEEPRVPHADGTDAMLKLVGTSISLPRHAFDAPAEHAFDDAVAELLRPMLRQWLEANMPRIVEKALRKELDGDTTPAPRKDDKGA